MRRARARPESRSLETENACPLKVIRGCSEAGRKTGMSRGGWTRV
jgi:hypothetical protein